MKPTFSQTRWTTARLAVFLCLATVDAMEAAELLAVRSPDEIFVATVVAEQGQIHYRRASDNAIQCTFYICHPQAICFSADGKLLAAVGRSNGGPGKIKVWHIGDHKERCVIVPTREGVNALALSADGNLLAGAGPDGRIEVWRVSDGESQWSRTLPDAAKLIRFSTGPGRLLVRGENGSEHQFNAGNGRPVGDRGH